MLELLRSNKDVQRLWLAQLLSFIGDWAALIALAGLLLDRTGSIALSTVPTIAGAAGLALGLLLVWVGDAYPKKAVLVISDAARALLFGLLGIFQLPLALIVGILILAGATTSIFNGARGAIWQEVAPEGKLQAIRSLSMITFAATTAIGSAIGAGLWQSIGAQKALIVNALTFLISGLLVSRITNPRQGRSASRYSLPDIIKTTWREPRLRAMVILSTFGALAAETAERLVVPYAHVYLSDGYASLLATLVTIGSLVGTVLITRYLLKRFSKTSIGEQVGKRLQLGINTQVFFYILILVALVLAPSLITASLVFVCVGLFFSFAAVVQPAAISLMPSDRQSGILGLIEGINYLAILLGSGFAGAAMLVTNPRIVIEIMVVISFLGLVIYAKGEYQEKSKYSILTK